MTGGNENTKLVTLTILQFVLWPDRRVYFVWFYSLYLKFFKVTKKYFLNENLSEHSDKHKTFFTLVREIVLVLAKTQQNINENRKWGYQSTALEYFFNQS